MSSTPSSIDAIATAADLPRRLPAALSAHPLWPVSGPSHSRCAGSGDPRTTTSGDPRTIKDLWADAGRFAPELSYGRHFGPAPATARQAAVVALLFRRGGRWHIPLTERPASLVRHGGQISLPGGTLEPGESTEQAALRELDEELGAGAPVDLVGRLSGCYVYASDYMVTPWVASTNDEPVWRPQADEVNRVLELPLAILLDEDRVGEMIIQHGPVVFRAPCFQFGEHAVWGATSIILGELADVLRQFVK